ncbi:J domain-containing protein [Azorhizobium doebereinerae]|uniref:J domain-containing protein n=1 Tax=Azorhizobium doebereinerae TaxID=281091 RepID=UPI00048DB821|nr:J domain-containing protein [Azorhizobium doebereinerae]
MTTAYPLSWPAGRPRRAPSQRKTGKFNKIANPDERWKIKRSLSVADAVKRLQGEIDRIGGCLPVISSNVELRQDGLPRSGAKEPIDPGVCLYFQLAGRPHAMPCDTYEKVADNIAAIAAHIEATRAIERHGVASISEMFAGFTALPAPGATRPWWEVLNVSRSATRGEIDAAYRAKARTAHSDAGGSDAAMSELNVARDTALKEMNRG